MGTITTSDRTQIYYKDWGEGRPVVFSHGWPLNADIWDEQLLFLSQNGFRVIAHDRRGHGRSSHSPYVIEQFDPEQFVILNRDQGGALTGQPIDSQAMKRKTFRKERRQFAEAILSRAVLVVEGATEAALFPVASSNMEASPGTDAYTHFDLAGVSVFNAGGLGSVPRHGPVISALGKLSFGFYDKPNAALTQDAIDKLKCYTQVWESPEKGIENVLTRSMGESIWT